MTNNLEAALYHASQGRYVFPCYPGTKEPMCSGGFKAATIDPDQIRAWFTDTPDANIGWYLHGSGLCAVDLDRGAPTDLDLAATLTVKTPSGGRHMIYKGRIPSSQSKLAPHVDTRGVGGYTLLPPSVIDERDPKAAKDPTRRGPYTWEDEYVWPAPVPTWVVEKLAKPKQEPRRASPDVVLDSPRRVALVQWLAALTVAAVEGEGSQGKTIVIANCLLDISSHQTVFDALLEHWAPRCTFTGEDGLTVEKWLHTRVFSLRPGCGRNSDIGCMTDDDVEWLWCELNSMGLYPGWEDDFVPDDTPIVYTWAPPQVAELLSKLSLTGWLNRDIKPQDFLIGEVMSTTSRMMLYAPTGLGKTNFSMAMTMHLAAGRDFLRWRIPQARTVLYIDGEMPDVSGKERLTDAVRRLGAEPDRFFYLNTVDFPDMPPLNAIRREDDGRETYPGQQFVDNQIAFIQNTTGRPVDLVVFDNIQALSTGNLRETDAWSVIRPWTQRLSARHIGQIWVHHTGANETKAYGDSTVQWQLDTVLRLERVKNERTDISFNLDFSGKARNRTSKNRADYATALVTLVDEKWTITTAVNTDLSRTEVGGALVTLGAKAGSTAAYDQKAGTGGVFTRPLAAQICRGRNNGGEPDAVDVDKIARRLTERAEKDLAAYVVRQGGQGKSRIWAILDGIE